ncbi:ADP-ribosylation factor-like protein 4 [Elsinoe australis]|uniref:ADP-ribosylation factor-like protein 4 n=1 Tax=Elsinoe australis TaxID=40998 RepID=A0A4U7B137_9PEZI|nr:ADP-ribosylation factor-like protein 4 [Elsinoe australis]
MAPGIFRRLYDWLLSWFWATEMDVTIVGLSSAGKTSLVRVLAGGEFTINSIPTVGFNMKKVTKGHVTLRCWDIGGQDRFIPMWKRYAPGSSAIVFVVDSANQGDLEPGVREEDKSSPPDPDSGIKKSKRALHDLMDAPRIEQIPLLVLGNKSDLPDHRSVDTLIEMLDLQAITGREVSCYGISAKEETNLDAVLKWLINKASK